MKSHPSDVLPLSTPKYSELSAVGFAYVSSICLAGWLAIVLSLQNISSSSPIHHWIALLLLTIISGFATIRLPSAPATISASDTFVLTSVLLFGIEIGTVTVAIASFVHSFRAHQPRRVIHRLVFNVSAPALSLWLAAHAYSSVVIDAKHLPLFPRIVANIFPLLLLATIYFLLNSGLTAIAISLEQRTSAVSLWVRSFSWLCLSYVGSVSLAAILVSYLRSSDTANTALVAPLMIVFFVMFRTSLVRIADSQRHVMNLKQLHISTIETLAMAIDAKDQITHGHVRRVQSYAVGLARAMGVTNDNVLNAIRAAALLHDIGKLGVPEHILNKPGILTPAEFDRMRRHVTIGADILSTIEFPYPVVPIVRHHHENFDGTGYPSGLVGTEIPLGARILAVADCFDALTSDRPYRPRLSDQAALALLTQRRGHMYDPTVVDVFAAVYTHLTTAERRASGDDGAFAAISESSGLLGRPKKRHGDPEVARSVFAAAGLADVARSITAGPEALGYCDILCRRLMQCIPASLCLLFAYNKHSDNLTVIDTSGGIGTPLLGFRIAIGERLAGWVAANRRSVFNADPALDLGDILDSVSPRPRSCLSTPLLHQGRLVGVLNVYSPYRAAFQKAHGDLFEAVNPLLAQLLAQARPSPDHSTTEMRFTMMRSIHARVSDRS